MEITILITVSQLCLRNTDLVYQYEAQKIGNQTQVPKEPLSSDKRAFHLPKGAEGLWKISNREGIWLY